MGTVSVEVVRVKNGNLSLSTGMRFCAYSSSQI